MDFFKQSRQIYIGKINTSETEIRDLAKAWLAISLAFAIVMRGMGGLSLYRIFIVASITVGTGFLLHELGHKIAAQRYGCFAEFRSFDQMLLLAVIMSLFGFVFAAPGAVMIHGPVGVRRNGIISAAGPVVNLALALIFLGFMISNFGGIIAVIGTYGFFVNSWLALFNMIPVWNMDGAKVLRWNKIVYGLIVAVALAFIFAQNFISIA